MENGHAARFNMDWGSKNIVLSSKPINTLQKSGQRRDIHRYETGVVVAHIRVTQILGICRWLSFVVTPLGIFDHLYIWTLITWLSTKKPRCRPSSPVDLLIIPIGAPSHPPHLRNHDYWKWCPANRLPAYMISTTDEWQPLSPGTQQAMQMRCDWYI